MSDSNFGINVKTAKATWESVGAFALLGVGIGIAFLVPGYFVEEKDRSLIHHISRDVGIGFIVAALSVFGYEFVRHVSGAIQDAETFKKASENILIASKGIDLLVGEAALPRCITRTFDENKDLRDGLIDLTEFSRQLSRSKDREYLDFVTWIITESAATSAEKLAKLRDCIEHKKWDEEVSYSMLDNRIIVSRLLRAQFEKLGKGDRYDSISNALFYDDRRLTEFEKAIERAKDKGVTIRRLFNVANFEEDPAFAARTEKFGKAKEVVRRHLDFVKKYQEVYQVRFLGHEIYDAAGLRFTPRYHFLDRLPRSYFGLFRSNSSDCTVIFSPRDHKNLSEIEMMASDSDLPGEVFDRLWDICAGTPNPFLPDSFEQTWSDEFVKHIRAG